MKIALLLLVLSLATPAQKWEHLTDSENQKVFTDVSTMSGDRSGKQMWFKYVPIQRARYVAKNKLPRNYDHQLVLLHFNCGQKTFVIKKGVWYSTKGTVLKTIKSTETLNITGLNAELYELVCP